MPRPPAAALPSAVLWGRDHVDYGDVVTRAVGEAVGLALTRGRHPKPYAWVDPNEDVVAAVVGPRATLLAVADAHNGADAAEAAITTVLECFGDDPPDDPDEAALVDLFAAAGHDVLRVTSQLAPPHRDSRTTLSVALVGPETVTWAALGDSPVFVVHGGRARELSIPRHLFVGHPLSRFVLDERLSRGREPLQPGDAVVLASDGFTNFAVIDPAAAVAEALAAAPSPVDAAAALVDHAVDGGAGDNVAVAVAAV